MVSARAVVIPEPGGPEVLALEEREIREPGPSEVLVEVAAAGLNRADLLQRRGLYPAPPGYPAEIPGLEYAGLVTAVGADVRSAKIGDRVMGITGGGAMATHLVAHERELLPVPEGMELARAAAIPEAFLTAYDALVLQAGVGLGSVVVIHAAGSGVGTAAIQLCRRAGARPLGTSRTSAKLDRCRDLGLEDGILAEGGRFADEVARRAGGRKADVILDAVGGAYLGENLKALAPRGTIIVLGLMGGTQGDLPMGALLVKRARLFGTVLRSRPLEDKAALAQEFRRAVSPLLDAAEIAPVVDAIVPMDQVADAHARMEESDTFGKVVLRW